MARISREYLESANRKQIKTYLGKLGHETYADESTPDLRETAIAYFEQTLPEEDSGLTIHNQEDYDYDCDPDCAA